jgi:uncharacterized membrane protein (DUF4010 family)
VDTLELFERLGLALAIGLLIGTERGWRDREGAPGSRTAGIRTYALSAFLGGMWAALVPTVGPWPLALAGFAFGLAFFWFQWRETWHEKSFSVTGVVTGLLTFALGAYAVLGDTMVAVAAGVATVALLAMREALHQLLKKITWKELRAAILLLAMTFLLLQVLPDRTIDPWNAINPHKLWLLTILIAAVSFAGHIAVRVLGQKSGVMVAAGAGSIVSSTLVTLNNARQAKEQDDKGRAALAGATCIAWAISLVRTVILAAALNLTLLQPLAPAAGAALLVFAVMAAFFIWRSRDGTTSCDPSLQNPFALDTVLLFGLLLAVVTLAAKLIEGEFHGAGLLPLAAIAGSTDIDAITLSMTDLAPKIGPALASTAILVGAASNATFRAALPLTITGVRYGLPLALTAAVAIGAGAIVWFATGGHVTPPT